MARQDRTAAKCYFGTASMCCASRSFSWQMNSISSKPGRQRTTLLVVTLISMIMPSANCRRTS